MLFYDYTRLGQIVTEREQSVLSLFRVSSEAGPHIKVNEFLAVCTKEDIEELYNSSAFNEITKAYAKKAMQNLVFKKEEVEAVQDEIKWLHDTMGAEMIVNE